MIEIQKIKIVEDEKMCEMLRGIIDERVGYYEDLFSEDSLRPRIVVQLENLEPFRMRIVFHPRGEKPKMIDIDSYSAPDVALKHGLKKLRRVAKNYYIKNKKRHR